MSKKRKSRHYLTSAERLLHKRAIGAVSTEIRAGRLVKPAACEECMAEEYVVAWHIDYSHLLNIRWLCYKCLSLKRQEAIERYKTRAEPVYAPLKRLVTPGRYRCLPCKADEHRACLGDGDEHDALAAVCRCECRKSQ